MQIDSHQHFWNYNPIRDSWIDEHMGNIKIDFLPEDLMPLLNTHQIEGCIAVQADQSEEETNFLLKLAEKNNFIKGVVGWVDLCDYNIESRLNHFSKFEKLVGIRHILQSEINDFVLDKDFKNGIAALKSYDLVYDILIFPNQLKNVISLVSSFPNQTFVLNHMAKPYIKAKKIDFWEKQIAELATYKNVYCKVSGMVTEANWKHWSDDDFKPYLDVVFSAFGTNRVMYGSDWPVCLLAAQYNEQLQIVKKYISKFSKEEQFNIMGKNAINAYSLKVKN